MTPSNQPEGYTLADYITIEMFDSWGNPMRLMSIVSALQNRGLSASPDAVSQALRQNPKRFKRVMLGVYELGSMGPLARKRNGRKLK